MNVTIVILMIYGVASSMISPKRKKHIIKDFSMAQPVAEPSTSEKKDVASTSELNNANNFSDLQLVLGKSKFPPGAVITAPKRTLPHNRRPRSSSHQGIDFTVKSGQISSFPETTQPDEPPTTQITTFNESVGKELIGKDTSSADVQNKIGECLSFGKRYLSCGEKSPANPETLKDKPLTIANKGRSSRKKGPRKSSASDVASTSATQVSSPRESTKISRLFSLTRIFSSVSPRKSFDESVSEESNVQSDSIQSSSRKKSIFHIGLKKKLNHRSSSLNENGFTSMIIDKYKLFVQPKDAKDEEKYLAKYFWTYYECVIQCIREENFSLKLKNRGINDAKLCELIAEQPEMINKMTIAKHAANVTNVNSKNKKAATSSDITQKFTEESNESVPIFSSSRETIVLKDYGSYFKETDLERKMYKFSPTTFSDVIWCNRAQNDYFFISQGVGPNSFFVSTSNIPESSESVTLIAHFTFGRDSDGHLIRLPINEEPYAAVAYNKLRCNQRFWSLERYHFPKPAQFKFPIPNYSWEYGFLYHDHHYLQPQYKEDPIKRGVSVRRLVVDVPLFSYDGKFTEEVEKNLVQYYMRHRDFVAKCEIDEPMFLKDQHFYGKESHICKMIAGDKKICEVLEINHSLRRIRMIDWATRKIFPYQYKRAEYVDSSVTDAIKCYYSFMITSWNKDMGKIQTVKVEDWFFVSNGVGRDSYFVFTEDGVDGQFLFRGHVTFKRDRRGNVAYLSGQEEKYSYMRAWENDSGKWDWTVAAYYNDHENHHR